MAICTGIDDSGMPEVMAIKAIEEGPQLVCRELLLSYNSHLRSYRVVNSKPCALNVTVSISELKNPFPLDVLFAGNSKYLSIRCALT